MTTTEVDANISLGEMRKGDQVHMVRSEVFGASGTSWNCGTWEITQVYRHIRAVVVKRGLTTRFVREGDPAFKLIANGTVVRPL